MRELRNMGTAVCGSCGDFGVAVWAGCSVGEFWQGELRCGCVLVWVHCDVGPLCCRGVVCMVELRCGGNVVWGSCGVSKFRCVVVAV